MKARIKYEVIQRHEKEYSITDMCRILEVSRSGYYDYLKRASGGERDAELAEQIRKCQERSRHTYGYRRVHQWLKQ